MGGERLADRKVALANLTQSDAEYVPDILAINNHVPVPKSDDEWRTFFSEGFHSTYNNCSTPAIRLRSRGDADFLGKLFGFAGSLRIGRTSKGSELTGHLASFPPVSFELVSSMQELSRELASDQERLSALRGPDRKPGVHEPKGFIEAADAKKEDFSEHLMQTLPGSFFGDTLVDLREATSGLGSVMGKAIHGLISQDCSKDEIVRGELGYLRWLDHHAAMAHLSSQPGMSFFKLNQDGTVRINDARFPFHLMHKMGEESSYMFEDLSPVTIEAGPGQGIVVVGKTGGGKTTAALIPLLDAILDQMGGPGCGGEGSTMPVYGAFEYEAPPEGKVERGGVMHSTWEGRVDQISGAMGGFYNQLLMSARDADNPNALLVTDELGSNVSGKARLAWARALTRLGKETGVTSVFTIQDADGLDDLVASGDLRAYSAWKTQRDGGGYDFHLEPGLTHDCGAIERALQMTNKPDAKVARKLFEYAAEELKKQG